MEESASKICKFGRDYYDCFGLPLSTEAYVPNLRIRKLLKSYNDVNNCSDDVAWLEYVLAGSFQSCHTWMGVRRESETIINDPNSIIVLNLIKTIEETLCVGSTQSHFDFILASNSSKPERSIRYHNYFVMCTESKGRDASSFASLVQGFEIGADAAAYMWRQGVVSDDVVVPVMLSFADCMQFYAVYLIPECYPVIVCLSPALSCVTSCGRLEIARWIIALRGFLKDTIAILDRPNRIARPRRRLGLYIDQFFFKPLCDLHKNFQQSNDKIGVLCRSSLEHIMSIYQRIYLVEDSDKYFLFPVGVLTFPPTSSRANRQKINNILEKFFMKYFQPLMHEIREGGSIVVAFPLLSEEEGWSNGTPPENYVQQYVHELSRAVEILDTAGVAHMDLRPSNIMWRINPVDNLEMRVIDLEDAEMFGQYIQLWEVLKADLRYPVLCDDDGPKRASRIHNQWFLDSVSAWALETNENAMTFTQFMKDNCSRFCNILK